MDDKYKTLIDIEMDLILFGVSALMTDEDGKVKRIPIEEYLKNAAPPIPRNSSIFDA